MHSSAKQLRPPNVEEIFEKIETDENGNIKMSSELLESYIYFGT